MSNKNRIAKQFFLRTDYFRFWENKLLHGYEEPHLVDFVRHLDLKETDFVLEIGCGGGRVLSKVAPHVLRCVGVDISRKGLRAGVFGSHLPGNVDLVVADASALPFTSSCFDKSYAFSTLFLVPDQSLVIQETARVGNNTTIEVANRLSLEGLMPILENIGMFAFVALIRIAGPRFAADMASLTLGRSRASRLSEYHRQGVVHYQFPVWVWTPLRCLKKSNMKIVSIRGSQKWLPWWFSPKIIISSNKISMPEKVA